MTNKDDKQKRLLIAMVLSFAFFIAFDYFYIQPQVVADKNNKTTTTTTNDTKHQAPTKQNSSPKKVNTAPTQQISNKDIISTIETKNNTIVIDKLGRFAQVTLKESQYIDEDGKAIDLFKLDSLKPLELRFSDRSINDEAFKIDVVASSSNIDAKNQPQVLTLTQTLSQTTITKTIKFYPDGHYDITINSSAPTDYFVTTGFRPDVLADMYADHGVLLKLNDETLTIVEDEDLKSTKTFEGVKFASAFDRYYATLLYNFKDSLKLSLMPDEQNNPQIFVHIKDKISLSGYMGPKEYKTLQALNDKLTDAIEYGWFTFIAKPMFLLLQFFFGFIGNWGWTIVLVTILIKIVLYPLAYKGMVSMNKLKEFAPKIKEIQTKYKDDKQKSGAKMMEFYKKEGVNPMGGCFPILLQIPVFFAIYRVLLNSIELKGSPWIWWIDDLAVMDPWFVLPILMGITMFVQQKITPNQIQDEMQKKLFQFLPVIFTFFFLWFPAGLTLYWFINNLFTIGQQYYINKLFERNKALRHEEHLAHKLNKDKK
ncbi:MAG: membrane protein insertase YidC [Campylobacteraceae bacterium 4484_166]|nr:MAG: membrane protein insertase YidC [Campylobacteraceae bacterium 4484_166]